MRLLFAALAVAVLATACSAADSKLSATTSPLDSASPAASKPHYIAADLDNPERKALGDVVGIVNEISEDFVKHAGFVSHCCSSAIRARSVCARLLSAQQARATVAPQFIWLVEQIDNIHEVSVLGQRRQ